MLQERYFLQERDFFAGEIIDGHLLVWLSKLLSLNSCSLKKIFSLVQFFFKDLLTVI